MPKIKVELGQPRVAISGGGAKPSKPSSVYKKAAPKARPQQRVVNEYVQVNHYGGGRADGYGQAKGGGGWAAKGASKGAKGGSKGAVDKTKEKMRATDPSLKVWIGGLPEGVTWKQIDAHFAEQGSKPQLVDLMKRGTGCVAYATEDEAQTAIAVVNGTDLQGSTIEVDSWTKPERTEKAPGDVAAQKPKPAKGASKVAKPPLSKIAEKIRDLDASLKIWIGGLGEGTTWQQVKEHFESVGEIEAADLLRDPSKAVVAFKNEDDAASAIAAMNGSDLNGATLEVDVWTMPERKEKVGGGDSQTTIKQKPKSMKTVIKTQFVKKEQWIPKANGSAKKLVATAKAQPAKGASTGTAKGVSKAAVSQFAEQLRTIDPSQKVWIGGLAQGTTVNDVQMHFKSVGEIDVTDILKKGRAVVAFTDASDVESAVASLNGSDLNGAIIEVDYWTKPERKVKADSA